MRIWVNGSLAEEGTAVVSVLDHGLTVGDGAFETTKIVDGAPFALTRHLDRLAASARGLGLPEPDDELVRRAVADTIAANDLGPFGRLRITYTGGVSPLGSERGDAPTTLIVVAAPSRPWPASTAVATVPWSRNERGAITGLKTTSYAENVVALARAKAAGAGEALLRNTRGNLCEGTGTNVFLVLHGRLVTPPLSAGCLPGITRGLLLEWVGAAEEDVPISALYEAEEVFITSSTRDVHPVHRVDDRTLAGVPGPFTRKAMDIFAERSAADIDP